MSGMVLSEGAYINSAINSARGAMNNALAQARRNAGRYGVDPSSGKFQAMERSALYENAAQTASAATEASKNWLEAAQKQDQHDDDMAYKYQQLENQLKIEQDKTNWEKEKFYKNRRDAKAEAREFLRNKRNDETDPYYFGAGEGMVQVRVTDPQDGKTYLRRTARGTYEEVKYDKSTMSGTPMFQTRYTEYSGLRMGRRSNL